MRGIYIKNADIVLKDALLRNSTLLIEGPRISAIGRVLGRQEGYLEVDARRCFLSPGFIDSHIHGRPEEIFSNEIRSGTTSIVIALSCGRPQWIHAGIDAVKRFIREDPLGENILGVRLEGPFINRERAGAQDRRYIKYPDREKTLGIINKAGGLLKMMTIAPELKGALGIIRLLKKKGVIASIGHSNASCEEALAGMEAGVTHATHIFNAMSGIGTRAPGAAGAALAAYGLTAEVIPDPAHVHPALVDLLLRVKGPDKVVFVTDSVRASPPEGARRAGGAYRFKDGRLAGSRLTMIEALKNAVEKCGFFMSEAARLVSFNPARLFSVEDKKGSIDIGKDADVVIFDKDFDVKMTIIGGKIVYRKKGLGKGRA